MNHPDNKILRMLIGAFVGLMIMIILSPIISVYQYKKTEPSNDPVDITDQYSLPQQMNSCKIYRLTNSTYPKSLIVINCSDPTIQPKVVQ